MFKVKLLQHDYRAFNILYINLGFVMGYIRRTATWLPIISTLMIALSTPLNAYAEKGLNVAIIAHSVSTRVEVRKIMQREGWTEAASLRQADDILVVCRSGLSLPLNTSYRTIKDLDDAVDAQLNISGSEFHIYIYQINKKLGVDEIKHAHYPADD